MVARTWLSMPQITISYRRRASQAVTGRIRDRVAQHFGENCVFMDIDNIPLGIDFRKHIDKAFRESQLLLVIIGPNWIGPIEGGPARICDPTDIVRIEVEVALRRGIPAIPVLVDGAAMPTASELPESLKDLPFYNAAELRSGADFHPHADRLIRAMEQIFRERGLLKPRAWTVPVRRRWLIVGVSGLFVVLLAFIFAYGLRPNEGGSIPPTAPRTARTTPLAPAPPDAKESPDNLPTPRSPLTAPTSRSSP